MPQVSTPDEVRTNHGLPPLTEEQREFVRQNRPLALWYANRNRNRNLTLDELVSECCVALCYAARKFDPSWETKFSAYAKYWMDQHIGRAFRQNSIVHVPEHAFFPRASSACAAAAGRVFGRVKILDTRDEDPFIVPDPADGWARDEQVHWAIGRLPDRHRRVVELRYFHGLSFRRIGEEVGVCHSHAGTIAREALALLRGIIAEDEGRSPIASHADRTSI